MTGRYKAYPEYKDSGVHWLHDIPAHWTTIPVGRCYRRVKRTGFEKEELLSVYRDHGVVPKSSRDDNNNKPSDDLSPYQLVCENNLVMNKMKAWQGSIAISEYRGIVSPAYFVYEPLKQTDSLVYPKYVHYLLRHPIYITQYMSRSKGIRVNQWDLDPDEFQSIELLLPHKDEQKKVINFLDHETAKIDTLIAKQEMLIELLKEKRQAVISHAVTKGLNPDAPMKDSGVEWLGEVPEHWGSSTVKNLCYVNDGNHGEEYPTESDFVDNRDGVPFIRAGDFDNLKIIENDLRYISHKKNDSMRKGRLQEGDILFVNRGATIGKLCIVDAPYAGSNLNSQIAYLRCNTNLADHRYVTYFLSSPYIQTKILAAIQGGALPQYPLKHIVNLDIWHGNIEEQKAISNFLDNKINKIKGLIEKSELAINLIKERKTALISAAVTGKIDVRDWQEPTEQQG
ncbi:MAG: restriction endonuclease subunit S [Vibrio sp.]